MSGFTEIFTGGVVSPSDVAYAAYEFDANLPLFWPAFANGNPNVTARFMNMVADAAGFNVLMPDATLNSVGYDAIIFNAGSFTFNVVTINGFAIATIAPGQTYYVILNNNSTQDGGWQTIQFGIGTGSANAAALAGAGLLALAGFLNVNLNAVTVTNSYTLTAAARDILQVWTGGTGIITLPSSSSVGNGFLFPLANNGSGSLTVVASGGDLIDGNVNSIFSQTQSGFIISTGGGWVTVGKGIQNTFAVTLLNLNVSGNSNITETSAQAQNIIQQFTGTLTGNINITVPNTVQLYFCSNLTSGAFTLTLRTAGGAGITIAQGASVILYCDGNNVDNAFTATITSVLTIPTGSANSPSLNVVGSLSTGIFSATPNTISTSANGTEVTRYASQASAVNYITETSSATGQPVQISSAGADATIPITIAGKGGAAVNLPNTAITGGSVNSATIGVTTPAAITGTLITATTGFSGNVTGNVTGNLTGNVTGSASLNLLKSSNLSDVATPSTALTNIGGAPLASPAFTGIPTAPTASVGTNTTQIATTAFANAISVSATNASNLVSGTVAPALLPNILGSFTYNVATASGSQTITGLGITPVRVRFNAIIPGTVIYSYGQDDGTTHNSIVTVPNGASGLLYQPDLANSIDLITSGGNSAQGFVSAFAAGSFTITWTKTGSPTGTARILYEAY